VAGGRLPAVVVLAALAATVLALAHREEIRGRAEGALGAGMPAREAELARGFVLGQDERIDPATLEDFRRSGLSHLLAVSGQNVALLALLAMPALAALGLPLRSRLLWVLGLIALYVPLAGAGPSILRAGIMGALSVLAILAGRRASRFYALVVAAILTLAVEPRLAADVGWQLSFAAVLGILLLAAPLRDRLLRWSGTGGPGGALAEGAALTAAASIATAPLIAFHFEAFSTLTLVANLLALPAVAPAMWLGMLAAAAGQVPGAPVEALNALNAPLLAYIAQVAAWCGRPEWAYVEVHLSTAGLTGAYAAIFALALALSWRRRTSRVRSRSASRRQKANARRAVAAFAVALAVVAVAGVGRDAGGAGPPRAGLRVSLLDVGQGDAILLQPAGAAPVLVDTGPPGEGLVGMLREAGVEGLGALVLTHDQSDHAGALGELLAAIPVGRLLYAALGSRTLAAARQAGIRGTRLTRGDGLRAGRLGLRTLWPPAELVGGPVGAADPNRLAVVLLVRWRDFSMLLTADAEAEATPLDPGPVDVLKVAHHGSEDAGLDELLEGARPRLALISVGEDNPFGHPAPATLLSLAEHRVRTLRTDRDGTVTLDVGLDSLRLGAAN
jgi:competence protein ComEC